ncbi:Exportin-T, partial [Armadillidium nasatum]
MMDPQMIQGLFTPSNNHQHSQALQNLQRLKEDRNSWKTCATTLATSGSSLDDKAKFVCLQVLEHFAKTSFASATTEDQTLFRQNVFQWMSSICLSSTHEKLFIRNKTAQLLSLIFIVDYISRWPTFIDDLLSMQQHGPNAVDLYLKILLAIDAEVQYEKSHPELVCHCHDVIGAYISWIDITIIANERFVSILVKHLKDPLLREAAADCIHEILQKGMEPVAKTQLIESFYSVLDQAGVLKPIDDSDSDFLVKLSKLVNCIGVQLISSWHKLEKKDVEKREVIRQTVENKITLLLQFMASEYDDVSALTFDFARDYIQLIKQSGHLTDVERGQLENMLYVIISKTKYDESYNFDQEGEDEAMFDDYRKHLKVVFDNLASLVPDLVLKVCKDYVLTTLNRWQSSPYEDVEAAVSLLFSLGEAIPSSHGNHFSGSSQAKIATLNELMSLMMRSGVSSHEHPSVALRFFECVTRYEKYFVTETQFIPEVLAAFLDRRGIRNQSPKVRSRVAYFFSRFVRSLKMQLANYTEQILTQVSDLLSLAPPENGQMPPLLSNDDQLYIYEAASILIVSGNSTPQQKEVLMRNLLSPVFSKVTVLAQRLATEQFHVKQLAISTSIWHATAVTARTTKAFSNQNKMKACNCVQLFLEAVQLFISCLNVGVEREVIGSGVRQLMHRMVVCLDGPDLIPILPAASQALLQTPTINALTEYLPLINQIIREFKKAIFPFLQEIFSPLVSAVFAVLAKEVEPNDEDEIRSRKALPKTYYLFLNTILSNGLSDVLSSHDPALLQQVLMSVVQGAVDFDLNDAQTLLALNESAMCLRTIYDKRGEEMIVFLRNEYLPKMDLPLNIINEYCQALMSDGKLFRNYCKFFFQRAK